MACRAFFPNPRSTHYVQRPAPRALRPFELLFHLLCLSHRAQRHATGDDRAEDDVDVEGVKPPPEERRRKSVRRDYAAERGAKCQLDGSAAAWRWHHRGTIEKA